MVNKFDLKRSYSHWLELVRAKSPSQENRAEDGAMQQAIGGEFAAFGIMERALLIKYGLTDRDYVIDVGCGAGRLAKPLSEFLTGKYLGTDIVPDLVHYARKLVNRPDWRFEVVENLVIPEQDEQASFVCFFSVFTHLLHEQSYTYLREAKRVLKPGGKVILSFLEFSIPSHWNVFEGTLGDVEGDHPLNVFLSRDAIQAWASHLGLTVEAIHDGDQAYIPIPYPMKLESGASFEDFGTLGQSVSVLTKDAARSS